MIIGMGSVRAFKYWNGDGMAPLYSVVLRKFWSRVIVALMLWYFLGGLRKSHNSSLLG